MHSRGPTEQCFCVLEPHHGCLLKVKKVRWYPLIKEGQRSHKYALKRANIAIKMKIALVPPFTILLQVTPLLEVAPGQRKPHVNSYRRTEAKLTSESVSRPRAMRVVPGSCEQALRKRLKAIVMNYN